MSKKGKKYSLQVMRGEYTEHNWIDNWNNLGYHIIVLDDYKEASPEIPVLCYSDVKNINVRYYMNNKQPAVYVSRGYLGNHLYKHRRWYRTSVNGWANIKLENIPYNRWNMLDLPKHPWKVKKVKNVLIAPSKMTAPVWDPIVGWDWAETMAAKFPGAEVKIRYKGKSTSHSRWVTLWEDLDWADLVVSQSSAITCEAFWYGKKVLSTEPCPTWAAGKTTPDNWQDPTEPPLRDLWHEHLAWNQFTRDEWCNGEVIKLIEKYVGPVMQYDSGHIYNFQD